MWQFIDALKLSQHFKVPLGGEPLNDSLEMTSITQHTWQRCIWQPILLLEASSPSPNSCLHVCSSHFSLASCLSLEMGRGRHCVPLQQSKCCSRTLCGQVLETAKIQRAVRLLTRRDAAVKSAGCMIFLAYKWNGRKLMEAGVLFQLAGIILCNNYSLK